MAFHYITVQIIALLLFTLCSVYKSVMFNLYSVEVFDTIPAWIDLFCTFLK